MHVQKFPESTIREQVGCDDPPFFIPIFHDHSPRPVPKQNTGVAILIIYPAGKGLCTNKKELFPRFGLQILVSIVQPEKKAGTGGIEVISESFVCTQLMAFPDSMLFMDLGAFTSLLSLSAMLVSQR